MRHASPLRMADTVKRALVSDVDNTLFDWVGIWYRSFTAMMGEAARISGIPADNLYPSVKEIFQRHKTSEYAFVLEEIPELRKLYGDRIVGAMEPAIAAYRAAREASLVP